MIKAILPIALFVVLAVMLGIRLSDPRESGSVDYALINTQITQIDPRLTGADLINVFASWCAPCAIEHPHLMTAAKNGTRIIGIAYKDAPEKTEQFLTRLGNPYTTVIHDPTGELGIKLGITGVPETIAVNPDGTIKSRFQGPIADETQLQDVLP